MPEFSPSFDRFDKAVLVTSFVGTSVATAGPTMATIGAGIALTVVGVAKAAVKLGESHHKRLHRRLEKEHAKQLAANAAILEAQRKAKEAEKAAAVPLKDDALWEAQWRENPWAFWLNPNLWKDGTSEIDWEAVDRPPPPVLAPPPTPPSVSGDSIEFTYRSAEKCIEDAVRRYGVVVPGSITYMGGRHYDDMFELRFVDGRKMLIKNEFLHRLTPSERLAVVQDKVRRAEAEKDKADQEEIKDILTQLRRCRYDLSFGCVTYVPTVPGKNELFVTDLITGELIKVNMKNPTLEEARSYAKAATLESYRHLWDDEEDDEYFD